MSPPEEVATLERNLAAADVYAAQVNGSLEVLEGQLAASLETVRKAKHQNRETHQLVRSSHILLRNWKPAAAGGTLMGCLLLFFCLPTSSPQKFEEAYSQGIKAQHARDFRTALKHYDVALKAQDSLTVLGEKAYSHFSLKEDDDAFATCDKMLSLTPTCGRAHYIKGLLYKRKGHMVRALEHFNLAAHHGEKLAVVQIRILDH